MTGLPGATHGMKKSHGMKEAHTDQITEQNTKRGRITKRWDMKIQGRQFCFI